MDTPRQRRAATDHVLMGEVGHCVRGADRAGKQWQVLPIRASHAIEDEQRGSLRDRRRRVRQYPRAIHRRPSIRAHHIPKRAVARKQHPKHRPDGISRRRRARVHLLRDLRAAPSLRAEHGHGDDQEHVGDARDVADGVLRGAVAHEAQGHVLHALRGQQRGPDLAVHAHELPRVHRVRHGRVPPRALDLPRRRARHRLQHDVAPGRLHARRRRHVLPSLPHARRGRRHALPAQHRARRARVRRRRRPAGDQESHADAPRSRRGAADAEHSAAREGGGGGRDADPVLGGGGARRARRGEPAAAGLLELVRGGALAADEHADVHVGRGGAAGRGRRRVLRGPARGFQHRRAAARVVARRVPERRGRVGRCVDVRRVPDGGDGRAA